MVAPQVPSSAKGHPPPRLLQPPSYSVAAQMARLHRLGRAHSHEGVSTTAAAGALPPPTASSLVTNHHPASDSFYLVQQSDEQDLDDDDDDEDDNNVDGI